MTRLLGSHMSTAGGIDKAIDHGVALGCNTIQIFVKNNNQWLGKEIPAEMIKEFKRLQTANNIFVFAHCGYLINLAAPPSENLEKSLESMRQELDLAESLGLPFTVVHPGAHIGQGIAEGIKQATDNFRSLIDQTEGYKVKILLETTAGQGTGIGSKFAELAELFKLIDRPERTGVCFDTCHVFAAGNDISNPFGYEKTWEEFSATIGLENLMAFHLNDSMGELGSHKDRHEHIGKGKIGLEGFRLLMNDQRFANLPMILETPKDPEMKLDTMNLATLRSLMV
ncbi:deoxyribonuclease IV [Candidatus Saganbacteria bacterium]|nr:deoxyribonuclease IV [Candidatus Saganbacteria bacterium]